MIAILLILLFSMLLALLLTPLVSNIGRRYNIVDRPAGRKVHATAVPRIGGIAIYCAFFLPFVVSSLLGDLSSQKIFREMSLPFTLGGATLVFLLGLADDVWSLRPGFKVLVQVAAAALAFAGGLSISRIEIPFYAPLELGWLSFPVTLSWYLLVVNAINLIDGLDGLAAGVCLFASLVLLVLGFMGDHQHAAMGLAAIAGSCLGFLRYNFNPASIFMGDGGSYFLGFMLASLSVLGSVKSQATVAILIPVVALGLPLMDTLLAPIRRFVLGRRLFQPDRGHIHHRLLKMGLSHRKAVLAMYGATLLLGAFALMMVNARDERAAGMLLALAVVIAVAVRKLGYLDVVAVDKVIGYFHGVAHGMGFQRDRRTFLNSQAAIGEARDSDESWERIIESLELLRMDRARLRFNGVAFAVRPHGTYTWTRHHADEGRNGESRGPLLLMDLPLADEHHNYGMLHLEKDLMRETMDRRVLRRIEHLRHSVVKKLRALEEAAREQGVVQRHPTHRP